MPRDIKNKPSYFWYSDGPSEFTCWFEFPKGNFYGFQFGYEKSKSESIFVKWTKDDGFSRQTEKLEKTIFKKNNSSKSFSKISEREHLIRFFKQHKDIPSDISDLVIQILDENPI